MSMMPGNPCGKDADFPCYVEYKAKCEQCEYRGRDLDRFIDEGNMQCVRCEAYLEVTQSDAEDVWYNANFGDDKTAEKKLKIVKFALLKCASGYHNGHTATQILQELNLITKEYKLTTIGRYNLWEWFGEGSNI